MSVTNAPMHDQALHEQVFERRDGFFAALADAWRDLLKTMFDTYRPERHYMRGPGPACARKAGLAR